MARQNLALTSGHTKHLRGGAGCLIASRFILLMSISHWTLAAMAPCESPPAQAQARLGYERGAAESFRRTGSVTLHRTHASFDTGSSGSGLRTRFSHDYNIYDIDLETESAPPSGNGHLHRFAIDADLSSVLSEGWHLRLQPALGVSSNQLRSPDKIRLRGLQLNAALLRHMATGPDSGWTVGLCADQRFGEQKIYPGISWQRATPEWFVQLGWPDSRLARQVTTSLHASLQVFPGGNRWHVLGQEAGQQRYHWFSHENWQARWAIEWRLLPALGLELSTSLLFDNRLSFQTEDGGSFLGKTDTPQQWELSLVWYLE